jgi:hypothetical protein
MPPMVGPGAGPRGGEDAASQGGRGLHHCRLPTGRPPGLRLPKQVLHQGMCCVFNKDKGEDVIFLMLSSHVTCKNVNREHKILKNKNVKM